MRVSGQKIIYTEKSSLLPKSGVVKENQQISRSATNGSSNIIDKARIHFTRPEDIRETEYQQSEVQNEYSQQLDILIKSSKEIALQVLIDKSLSKTREEKADTVLLVIKDICRCLGERKIDESTFRETWKDIRLSVLVNKVSGSLLEKRFFKMKAGTFSRPQEKKSSPSCIKEESTWEMVDKSVRFFIDSIGWTEESFRDSDKLFHDPDLQNALVVIGEFRERFPDESIISDGRKGQKARFVEQRVRRSNPLDYLRDRNILRLRWDNFRS